MDFIVNGRKINAFSPPYIIAELSANHAGSIDAAFNSIRMAKEAGADAVKLQTYTADTMTIDCDSPEFIVNGGLWNGKKLYDLYMEAHTPFEWHSRLFDYAKQIGITIFSTPFDETAVDLLQSLSAPAFKIASFELTDLPLIRYVARTGKPIFISTGMATFDEIEEAIDAIKGTSNSPILVFHCISNYPADVKKMNLSNITSLKSKFKIGIGLSDHSLGNTAAITSIALGACAIEKHFTPDKSIKTPDSDFSIDSQELSSLVVACQDAWHSLGQDNFVRSSDELDNKIFRRSIYFVRPIKKGNLISSADIKKIRPGLGLETKYFDSLIGKRISQDVQRGQPVSWELIDSK